MIAGLYVVISNHTLWKTRVYESISSRFALYVFIAQYMCYKSSPAQIWGWNYKYSDALTAVVQTGFI